MVKRTYLRYDNFGLFLEKKKKKFFLNQWYRREAAARQAETESRARPLAFYERKKNST